MHQADLTIVNRLGLHARAAGKFVNVAKTYASRVTLARGDKTVDGKSIMSVMLLAAPMGTALRLTVEGPDADEAFTALCALVNDGFGESE